MIENTDAEQIERLNARIVELLRERDDLLKANQVLHNLLTNREAEIAALRDAAQSPLPSREDIRNAVRSGFDKRGLSARREILDDITDAVCAVTSTVSPTIEKTEDSAS
jgi:hypothetical protein